MDAVIFFQAVICATLLVGAAILLGIGALVTVDIISEFVSERRYRR